MRAHEVDLSLRNGSHPDLVKRSREESGKSAGKDHITAPCVHADGHAHHVLLGDEALNKAIWVGLLVGEGKGGVLGVSIHALDAVVRLAKVHEPVTIGNTGGHLGCGTAVCSGGRASHNRPINCQVANVNKS